MTSNTSPKKPDWFALIEKDAPSAQVRKVDKKLPFATGMMAIAIVALGTFFANGSMKIDSSPTSDLASASVAAQTSASTSLGTQPTATEKKLKVTSPQSINRIADPTLNGGGDDDDDYEDEEDDEYEDD